MNCPTCNAEINYALNEHGEYIVCMSRRYGYADYVNNRGMIQRSTNKYSVFNIKVRPLTIAITVIATDTHKQYQLQSILSDNFFILPNEEFDAMIEKIMLLA